VVPPCSRGGPRRRSVQLGHVLRQWVTGLPRMQSRRCRGTAVQLMQATQTPSSTWAYATLKGDGVAKDAEQAVSWYRRAAKAGRVNAQFNLGLRYYQG